MRKPQLNLKRHVKWTLISILVGFLAGLSSSIFLILLDWATKIRIANYQLIFFLPIAGFVIGILYHYLGKDVSTGTNLILDEIHDPKKIIPFRMTPFVLFGTVVTHLFGGSVGREGTAVQMGASLADQIARILKISPEERKILLVAGAGAGFGATIGTPWAGVVFGMEVLSIGRLLLFAWFECLIASYVGIYVSHLCQAPHGLYPVVQFPFFQFQYLLWMALVGAIFGLTAALFIQFTHFIERLQKNVPYSPFKLYVDGMIIAGLYAFEGTFRFAGLGIDQIQNALVNHVALNLPALKISFTGLSIGSGFKGGEFIPLVFIGTTLGSFLSSFTPLSCGVLGAVGFAAVFAGASNAPIACSIMAIEIFGFDMAPYAIIGCFASYYFSGHHGIYKSQKIHSAKHRSLLLHFRWFGELPNRFLKERN